MVIGKGYTERTLSEIEVFKFCSEAFETKRVDGKRILFIIPDHTRTAPIDMIFKIIYDLLSDRVKALDFLVALGTHPPMSYEAINKKIKITKEERNTKYSKAHFFNHHWKNRKQLRLIGTITEKEVEEISNGLMHQKVNIVINKMIFNYDLLVIIGPTFPHEVLGFSGGNKYLFPGIDGQEIIDTFHWLGALITTPKIIGKKYTLVKKVLDKATSFLNIERMCLSLVVKGNKLAGLYIGTPEEAWEKAANLSDKLHIIYKERPFRQVLSCAPVMYDDLWTGGKCMYKLEPNVEDGGELIIYAPHIKEISVTHGEIIRKIGYHVRDYFTMQMKEFRNIPKGIMAHSTNVKGIGTFKNGIEKPRIKVILSTQIQENICKEINMEYCDPNSINIEDWKDREDEGILYVPKAGEILYRLKNDPF
ncbi:MAG: lactate racemase domain-containing protein [Candidatus Marinimicrobia bacterium]|nr:DUF2088 domain-containing protein [bacterium]MCG2716766.1 lactate racemase domain-containing protein [Candidatus Neomarinimicrobiota bacterium]